MITVVADEIYKIHRDAQLEGCVSMVKTNWVVIIESVFPVTVPLNVIILVTTIGVIVTRLVKPAVGETSDVGIVDVEGGGRGEGSPGSVAEGPGEAEEAGSGADILRQQFTMAPVGRKSDGGGGNKAEITQITPAVKEP